MWDVHKGGRRLAWAAEEPRRSGAGAERPCRHMGSEVHVMSARGLGCVGTWPDTGIAARHRRSPGSAWTWSQERSSRREASRPSPLCGDVAAIDSDESFSLSPFLLTLSPRSSPPSPSPPATISRPPARARPRGSAGHVTKPMWPSLTSGDLSRAPARLLPRAPRARFAARARPVGCTAPRRARTRHPRAPPRADRRARPGLDPGHSPPTHLGPAPPTRAGPGQCLHPIGPGTGPPDDASRGEPRTAPSTPRASGGRLGC